MKTLPSTLHRAMPIVAAALGRKFGVAVRVGGTSACTDGQTIVVPSLPADSALLPVAWGYLAHEAAHVRHTDFTVYAAAAAGDALSAQILNILEDVRVEQAMAGPYPGTRETLQAVCAHLLAQGGLSAPDANAHPGTVLSSYLLLGLRHRVLGYRALAAEAQRAETVLRAVFPAPTVHRLQGLLAEVGRLDSTQAAVALTRRIRALLEAEQPLPDEPQSAPRQAGGDPPTDTDAADQADAGGQPSQAQGAPSGSDARAGTDPAQTDDAEADRMARTDGQHAGAGATGGGDATATSGGQAQPAQGTPDQALSARSQDQGTSAASATDPSAPDQGPVTGAQQEALRQALSATSADLPGDLFGTVRDLLSNAGTGASQCVLPRGEPFAGNAHSGMHLLAAVQQTSRALTARLHGLVQASRLDRPQPRRDGPRLLPKRLYRAALGDPRLFARKRERVAVNTALHLLLDLSGSMGATVHGSTGGVLKTRCMLAQEAALALALALDGIHGVSLAVSAFPNEDGHADALTLMVRHGERPRARAGAFLQLPRGSTPMAGALWFAAADLLARPETRRVILVLTDGKPDQVDSTREILRLCRAADLETVGIGIDVDVSWLFPVALRVSEVTELKRALFGAAEQLLLAA
ncbi:VWA domain-containing protein [Thiohalocapsa marina]|uniref:VWA domain-containing protein n=1 Tax=Thiohalocapsa marina TaxID=424902 RepID=UPI0036DE01C3